VVPGPQAQAAFEQHCKAARLYQQQGQYVRAADAFALALAYRPNDANAYLGKAHAMLAAGQYPGSGTALAKAVELDPKGALRKVDLVGIAGGPDRFIACFTDLAQYAEAHSSPEQHFLLAYIYYQMDQLDQARAAIEAAQAGSSSPAAVGFLRAAISH
jgi:tetratricopeptide (TPR) repeat protein